MYIYIKEYVHIYIYEYVYQYIYIYQYDIIFPKTLNIYGFDAFGPPKPAPSPGLCADTVHHPCGHRCHNGSQHLGHARCGARADADVIMSLAESVFPKLD
jgi:hypothetical protein